LSPTGGKMQAVASFCMKIMHPDIHILYPVVRQFAQDYTQGCASHEEYYFDNFSELTKTLSQYRKKELAKIGKIIKEKLSANSA
jgi:hypothetical protein